MSEPNDSTRPILRDYLYLDVDKVKSIAGQLDLGVAEGRSHSEKRAKKFAIGWDRFLSFSPESSVDTIVQRSMLDSLFPDLESTLEADWLVDISDEIDRGEPGVYEEIRDRCPAGSIVRIEADGYLIDSHHVGNAFANISVALNGLQVLSSELVFAVIRASGEGIGAEFSVPLLEAGPQASKAGTMEEAIYTFAPQYGLTPEYLRALVRITRGLLPPGLNIMYFSDSGEETITISTLLQADRRYLDADPEVVGSRFGFGVQRWTVVGTIGHYSNPADEQIIPQDAVEQLAAFKEGSNAENFDREDFIKRMTGMMGTLATNGLLNLPQYPGLTIIPIAVYRAI